MNQDKPKDLPAIIAETDLVERALRKAWAQALRRHKRLGDPIVVWRDGQVVWIPANEIELPDDDSALSQV
jgi:hypothetical protein